jgi:hypothetical protein
MLEDVEKQAEDILILMTVEEWVSVCRHVKEVEKIYIKNVRVKHYAMKTYGGVEV